MTTTDDQTATGAPTPSDRAPADHAPAPAEHPGGNPVSGSTVTGPDTVMLADGHSEQWWKTAVVYQIYPRSFADADGDGVGDIRGIIDHVDYLATLGVDVVWVSPFYTSPMDDNGYDIADYQDVDPLFGTLADIDELIAALHARGMKLMIDVVVNHTSDVHPWFVESRSSKDNPKRDWYWWHPGREGMTPGHAGAEPTNWQSFFSGPVWELDETTGEYYLHLFSRRQPDLNWENPQVREAVHAMLRWWLERGVDGFRMDVINMISKVLPLADEPAVRPATTRAAGEELGDGSGQYIGGPRLHEFLHELNAAVIAGRETPLITVGETPGITVAQGREMTDPARAEVDMVFQFEHVGLDHGPGGKFDPTPLSLVELKASLNRWQQGLAGVGWNSLYWNNHDQPRAVSRFGSDAPAWRVLSAKLLGTVLHLHRGTPYVYEGEELGMTNYPFTAIGDYQDIETVNYYAARTAAGADPDELLSRMAVATRDNARTPMQWDASANAGFTTGTPWLAVNPNHVEINAAAQLDDPASVFAHYQALIRLRHELPVVALGAFSLLLPEHEQLYAFTRTLDDDELLVLANFSETAVSIDPRTVASALPGSAAPGNAARETTDWTGAELLLGNYPDAPTPGSVRPWEAVVYRRADGSRA